ncbi:MAG TPA: MBL fold metallo-hydrolase [Beijerinckiaceae bacterium]|jgi:phosphoribosyl 1,2-cyclic phosphate phosphodiesterase
MSRRVVILGCGSSGGVPRVGGEWGACDPADPKNRRRRCSILVERTGPDGVTTALVDTSPDLRDQLLDAGVTRLDGVLITHSHADHTHGIDDVRPLVIRQRGRIDIHMDDETASHLRARFGYVFETPPGSQYPPLLTARRLEHGAPSRIEGPGGAIEAIPFRLEHGDMEALGFRFGDMAYTPDVIGIPEESRPYLEGLDLWIIDALRYTRHPSHFSLEEALAWIARMRPRRAVLTNLHTDLDYARLKRELPRNVEPAYDGLELAF